MTEISVAAVVKDAEGNLQLKEGLRPLIARHFGAGEDVTITIRSGDEPHTARQSRGFHAMLQPWCKSGGYSIDDLKLDLLGEVFGWSEAQSPISGRLMPMKKSTSALSKKDYSELIERTLQIAAECGVVLKAPDEYRIEKEARARKRGHIESRARRDSRERPAQVSGRVPLNEQRACMVRAGCRSIRS